MNDIRHHIIFMLAWI